ncbi:MAG: BatA domain-containing protein [Acidobacteria bacterium]|nr:BatA domain-containing protein [Acidobacteriota bacterium]
MELLNLTLAELLTVVVPIAAGLVALYFYDRSRRRRVVSTLRFWSRRPAYPMSTRRRRLQQPWSLLLQLLAAIFILLAIADLRFSGGGRQPRYHVVIVETSAWMSAAADAAGGGTLLDLARRRAVAFLDALPADDLVLLIRGDGNPMVVQGFTANRVELRAAFDSLQASWTAANTGDALELAKSALRLTAAGEAAGDLTASNAVGEVAYIGSARVPPEMLGRIDTSDLPHFRYVAVGEKVDDVGLTRISAQRQPADPKRWRVVAAVHNQRDRTVSASVEFAFEGRRLGYKAVDIAAESRAEVIFHLGTEQPGILAASLADDDRFAGNNRAQLELPGLERQTVHVTTTRASLWKPFFEATPMVQADFSAASDGEQGPLRIFDGLAPASRPAGIYVRPLPDSSPIRVVRSVGRTRVTAWASNHAIGQGLRSRDFELKETLILEAGPEDVVIAECEQGPVIVARESGGEKTVVYGFDPLASAVANQLVTPLLLANTLRWFGPNLFLSREVLAGPPGLVETAVSVEDEREISVVSAEDPNLPWSLEKNRLRFFMPVPGNVRVRTPFRESSWSLTLPELGSARWEIPENALLGVPPSSNAVTSLRFPLWPWLALLAVICWLIDWFYYGRMSPPRSGSASPRPTQGFESRTLGDLAVNGSKTPSYETAEVGPAEVGPAVGKGGAR